MTEKAVVFITIVAAVLGWLTTRVVDRITGAPTVEYRIDVHRSSRPTVTVTLLNVTRTQEFRNLRVVLRTGPRHRMINADVHPVEPAFEGDRPPTVDGHTAEVVIEKFMPGSSVVIRATYNGGPRPVMSATSDSNAVRLLPSNWETWLAKNELRVLFWVWTVWVGGLMLAGLRWAYLRVWRNRHAPTEEHCAAD